MTGANQIILAEQHSWVNKLRMEPVIINHEMAIIGTKDTAAELRALKKTLLLG